MTLKQIKEKRVEPIGPSANTFDILPASHSTKPRKSIQNSTSTSTSSIEPETENHQNQSEKQLQPSPTSLTKTKEGKQGKDYYS